MTARPAEDYEPQDALDDANLADWLDRVATSRDFSLPSPACLEAEAVLGFLFAISTELNELAAVVNGALGAARRDAESLSAIASSTSQHEQSIRETASAIHEAELSATHVAQTDEALRRVVSGAFEATDEATAEFEEIRTSLAGLGQGLAAGVTPLTTMEEAVRGVGVFLRVLKKMSQQAQLLGVNASVEASHIGDAGARFAIVASEVRKLAGSTRASCDDINRLIGDLGRATDRLTAATRTAQLATDEASQRIDAAYTNLVGGRDSLERVAEVVERISGNAADQSTSLHNVVASIEEISRHASGVSKASAEAAALDLLGLVQEAERSAHAWRLLQVPHAPPGESTPFSRWLRELLAGRDPADPFEGEADYAQCALSVRTVLDAVNRDERTALAQIVGANVAAARNGFSWLSIASSLDALRGEIGNVALAVERSVKAARTAAEISASMHVLVEEMRGSYGGATTALAQALGRIETIVGGVGDVGRLVDEMETASGSVERILELLESISAKTNLLALNAAIESAHAGDRGRGFAVIAKEIRSLARSTHESTRVVAESIARVGPTSSAIRESGDGVATGTQTVHRSADLARAALKKLHDAFEATVQCALDVSATADQQSRALDAVLKRVNAGATSLDYAAARTTDARRLELVTLGSRSQAIAARRSIGTEAERVRTLGNEYAKRIEAVIEAAIASKKLTRDALLHSDYVPITGERIKSLAHLFDVSRVPATGFSPEKYATRWDSVIEEPIIDILEHAYEELLPFGIATIVVGDLNSFVYAYPRRQIAAWTGDPVQDIPGNRIKRLFEDPASLAYARHGLGPAAEKLAMRAPYQAFIDAGCTLKLPADGRRAWESWVYARDTGVACNEVIVGLYVRGHRHGNVRIIYDANVI
ncbi:MAG: methyl-accepting chemotaxis protein [Candidatus Aquilonibacter sp.]